MLRCSGACHRVPLRFACRALLRFVAGADSRSIRAPPRRLLERYLGCRIKHCLSAVLATFRALFRAPSVRYFEVYCERYFKHCPYVVSFAFAASPVSPLEPSRQSRRTLERPSCVVFERYFERSFERYLGAILELSRAPLRRCLGRRPCSGTRRRFGRCFRRRLGCCC